MKKKWATCQSCIRKEVTSYKIHTLVSPSLYPNISGPEKIGQGVVFNGTYRNMKLKQF